jgi:hypothetical protein
MKLLERVKESIVQILVENSVEKRKIKSIVKNTAPVLVYNFTTSNHNYCLYGGVVVHNCDTISMLGSLKAWKPSEEALFKPDEDDKDIWALDMQESSPSNLHSYIV